MGIADFTVNMTLRGTHEEVEALEGAFKEYVAGKNGVSFSDYSTSNRRDGCVKIVTSGPWGRYGVLNDVDVFRDMAEAAPNASFEAEISGNTTYTYQSLKASLSNGILHISTFIEGNEEADEAYSAYFQEVLPYDKFIELFHLDEDEFDEVAYDDFTLSEITEDFSEWDYDRFMETFEDFLAEDIDEAAFEEIWGDLLALNIQSFDDFRFANEDSFGSKDEMDYDPVAKAYVGRPAPLKSGRVYTAAELADHGIDVNELASLIFGNSEEPDDE